MFLNVTASANQLKYFIIPLLQKTQLTTKSFVVTNYTVKQQQVIDVFGITFDYLLCSTKYFVQFEEMSNLPYSSTFIPLKFFEWSTWCIKMWKNLTRSNKKVSRIKCPYYSELFLHS